MINRIVLEVHMPEPKGRSLPLSLGRRVVGDFLHASKKMPMVTIQKDMNLTEVARARKDALPRPSWCSIFTKAYAKVVAATPELRRVVLTAPWERMYEYRLPTADVVIEARIGDENILCNVPLSNPDTRPLTDIDCYLVWCKEKPVDRLRGVRRALHLARLPRWVRRLFWWYLLNVSGGKRARYFSTFGVTTVSNWGVESLRPLAPWTSLLHYGMIADDGKVAVRLTYDHRVMDGSGPSKALVDLDGSLHTEILAELKSMDGGAASLHEAWSTQPIPLEA
jgi:hypothetical protein